MIICVTLLTLYSFIKSQSESLKVFGPEAPLDAVRGKDLVLPCFIKPNTSAVDMTVEWFRLDLSVNSEVHLYRDHEDRNEEQAPFYRGRTSLFKEELQNGNASLKLLAVRVSDEGEYKCLIKNKSWSDDITIRVIVEAQGSNPVIRMESYDNSGGINLVCESRGWNPEPEVLWLNSEGDTLPAEDTQIHRDTEGFNVKRQITVHDYSDPNRFFCTLLQKHHMMKIEFIIDSKVFEAWKWNVGILVSACVITVIVIVTAAIWCKQDILKQKHNTELQKKYTGFIKKLLTVDVTLDPDTAHPDLRISPDGKQMILGETQPDLTDTPERFTLNPSVVGKQSFSLGKFYYEVQVRENSNWMLGVMRESVNRKENISLKPHDGLWTVGLWAKKYCANAGPDVPLTLKENLEKLGVFVDYEEGLVAFYDVESRSHIYSFTGQSFTEKLYPYFCTWDHNHLSITAVTE
ncbi:butyrophilin subfamily 1 member A1-like isoform 1-T3 [Clarias gariepinus]